LFFNNLVICHIESSVSQLSLFSLSSTLSLLWTQFLGLGGHHVDTKVDTKTATATTRSSLPEENAIWCPRSCSPTRKIHQPFDLLRVIGCTFGCSRPCENAPAAQPSRCMEPARPPSIFLAGECPRNDLSCCRLSDERLNK
jgi:hypothetical protein